MMVVVTATLSLALLLLDSRTSLGFAVGVCYAPLLCLARSPQLGPLTAAGIFTVFIWIGWSLAPNPFLLPDWLILGNRLVSTCAVWMVAIALQRKALHREASQILAAKLLTAQEVIRRRTALEVHDSLGQMAAGLALLLRRQSSELAKAGMEAEAARATQAGEIAKEMVEEVRSIAERLFPRVLTEQGLVVALQREIRRFEELHAVQSTFRCDGWTKQPNAAQLTVYRVAQECLANVAKHANATRVCVQLAKHCDRAVLTVQDDGVGIPDEVLRAVEGGRGFDGVGLAGLMERVREAGGRVRIESERGAGTTVRVEIPLPEED